MGRKKGQKHDHQSKSSNVQQYSEKLAADGSTSESATDLKLSESPDQEAAASSVETIDVLGNGLIIKKTLKKGLGGETRPSHGDSVVVNYKCWLEDGTLVDDAENVKMVLGDGDIIHAFDLSIPLAEHKEIFELTTDSRFAYGSRGRDSDIPSGAKLTYRIEVLKVDDPPCYASMSNSERLAVANQKKDRGNYYYRREEFAFAIDSYNKALKILQLPPVPPTQSSEERFPETDCPAELINDAKLKLENNLAAAQLKALLEMNEVDDAIPILQKVLTISPGSQMASVELARAQAVRQKEREHWSRSVNRRFPKTKQNKNTKLSAASRVKLLMTVRCQSTNPKLGISTKGIVPCKLPTGSGSCFKNKHPMS
ncbi:FK506-binding protein 8 [Schistosoma bovis]|uniref:peptidylprolyl isomerase n=1 Tax=Schistosoma bovis TaxID=6184 RepID=A0A430QEQ7_SCHBO|nr:FK506-binding protein 8 [Schistosoma bovis]